MRVAVGRLLLEGLGDQRLDPRITDDPRPARTRLVGQTLEPGIQEPRTPLRDRRASHLEILGDLTSIQRGTESATAIATAPKIAETVSSTSGAPLER